jgi:aspartyl-tRNA(Asn)/glutamyl-tRNA(Gln) amidotransferase subunit C
MPEVKIDEKLLLKVAKNARLNLSEAEVKEFLPQLKEIIKSFNKLDSLNVFSEKPSFQPRPLKNVFREDKKEKCLSQKEALSNTKHKKDGYFLGPKSV